MSVSSTGVAVQVEDAKKTVAALEEEQKDLEEKITLLEEYCFEGDPKLLAKLVKKQVYVKTADDAKSKVAKLTGRLTSASRQLELALEIQRDAQAAQLVAAQREAQWEALTQSVALLQVAMLPRDSTSNSVNERMKAAFGNECFACGYKEPEVEDRNWLKNYYKVANAQLVAASEIYDMPQLGFDKSTHTDTRNFLRLCGTNTDDVEPGDEGYRGRPSCHRMFANHMMSFVPAENADPDDCCSWRVFGGADLHDKQVQLPTLPHKIVMYTHLKTCADKRSILFCDTLESKATPIAAVTSWLDQVTPPRSSEQSKSSSPTDQ